MCKSKFQLLYTYLLIAFVALVGVANHFNFASRSASDSFMTEELGVVDLEKDEVELAEMPELAQSYQTKIVNLPAVSEIVKNTGVDAGYGINRYHSLLYGHSTRAGGAFKKLYVGDLFTAVTEVGGARRTYRVVARKVYNLSELTDTDNIDEIKTIYEYKGGITLMTCGNGYNNDNSKRLVLWAVAA